MKTMDMSDFLVSLPDPNQERLRSIIDVLKAERAIVDRQIRAIENQKAKRIDSLYAAVLPELEKRVFGNK